MVTSIAGPHYTLEGPDSPPSFFESFHPSKALMLINILTDALILFLTLDTRTRMCTHVLSQVSLVVYYNFTSVHKLFTMC